MKRRRRGSFFLLAACLFFIFLGGAYLFLTLKEVDVSPRKIHEFRTPKRGLSAAKETTAAVPAPLPEKRNGRKTHRPRIAIIIDDLGHNVELGFAFINLDLPLSLAILPSAPFTNALVQEARKRGRDVILHQPMEPKDYPCVNPGPGALLLSMSPREIRNILDRNLKQVPGARGVNNHMGSSFTEHPEKMALVLGELKKRGLFYIDSRTTKRSVGIEKAREIGLPAAGRTVFLDNDTDPDAICARLDELISAAKGSRAAIGIGHPYKETIDILRKYQTVLKYEVETVPVSELIAKKKTFF